MQMFFIHLPDYGDHMRVMKAATTALKAEYGTHYRYGPIHKVIYQAGGGSNDYIYEALGVKYSFALELRDTGRYAFLLPKEQILPTVKVRLREEVRRKITQDST